MSCHIKILASILLLWQISITTSYPVINEGEQKQDVLHRDSADRGEIMEENALQRTTGSSEQRNGTLSSFLSLLPAHARVARHSDPCVRYKIVISCDSGPKQAVYCEDASHECNHRQATCEEKAWSTCTTINGNRKTFATDCGCL